MDEGKSEPLFKVAALSGFNQMKVFLLTKPMKDLGCGSGFKKQRTEKQTLDRLIQTTVPGEALLAPVAKRGQQVMDVHDSILALQEGLQAVENVLAH